MIEIKNADVCIGKRKIIDNVSFKCDDGSITVILGKNGCGKTTLLKAVSGIYPHNGSILINNIDIQKLNATELSKLVSFMPQALPLPSITVKKLVEFGRSPYTGISGILSDKDRAEVEKAIKLAEIEDLADSNVDKLSGGERRKAFFAMTLAQNCSNVLLDEPTANLDVQYTSKLVSLMHLLKKQGKTVVTVFHDINSAFEFADSVIFISNGQVVFSGTPLQAQHECIPQRIFGLSQYKCIDENGAEHTFYR